MPLRDRLKAEHTEKLCLSMLDPRQQGAAKGEVDFSYSIPKVSRFRVNVYRQRESGRRHPHHHDPVPAITVWVCGFWKSWR